jgi:hypothetical protein
MILETIIGAMLMAGLLVAADNQREKFKESQAEFWEGRK